MAEAMMAGVSRGCDAQVGSFRLDPDTERSLLPADLAPSSSKFAPEMGDVGHAQAGGRLDVIFLRSARSERGANVVWDEAVAFGTLAVTPPKELRLEGAAHAVVLFTVLDGEVSTTLDRAADGSRVGQARARQPLITIEMRTDVTGRRPRRAGCRRLFLATGGGVCRAIDLTFTGAPTFTERGRATIGLRGVAGIPHELEGAATHAWGFDVRLEDAELGRR